MRIDSKQNQLSTMYIHTDTAIQAAPSGHIQSMKEDQQTQ